MKQTRERERERDDKNTNTKWDEMPKCKRTRRLLHWLLRFFTWLVLFVLENNNKKKEKKTITLAVFVRLAVCKWNRIMPMWHTGKSLTSTPKCFETDQRFIRCVACYHSFRTVDTVEFVACKQFVISWKSIFFLFMFGHFGLSASSESKIADKLRRWIPANFKLWHEKLIYFLAKSIAL